MATLALALRHFPQISTPAVVEIRKMREDVSGAQKEEVRREAPEAVRGAGEGRVFRGSELLRKCGACGNRTSQLTVSVYRVYAISVIDLSPTYRYKLSIFRRGNSLSLSLCLMLFLVIGVGGLGQHPWENSGGSPQ